MSVQLTKVLERNMSRHSAIPNHIRPLHHFRQLPDHADPLLSLPPLQLLHQQHHQFGLPQLPLRPAALPAAAPAAAAAYHPTRFSNPRAQDFKMAFVQSDEQLAQLQKLSNEYEPEVAGPLVGERQPTSSITDEYANSDPVYRVKTAALPQKYAFYRTCRGDGHCGWRAVAFGYFEALLRLGDKRRFYEEETRLRSMKNLLNAVGFQEHLYEDFADDTYELLRKLAASLPVVDEPATLMQSFNDEPFSASIITYLKLLTSAWMQNNPAEFQPFLLGQDIRQYCATSIEPHLSEIEHVGLTALVDVLIKPAGFAVEISYLDRSPGDEVNMYRFEPSGDGLSVAEPLTVRLLYRPGHYDLLYKLEDVQRTPPPAPPQPIAPLYVALASPVEEFTPVAHGYASHDWRSMIPGMSTIETGPQWLSGPCDYLPKQELSAKVIPTPAYPSLPVTRPVEDHRLPSLPLHTQPPQTPQASQLSQGSQTPQERAGPFRSSIWELEQEFASPSQCIPLQTSIFRNSHYNTAHFLNPDFQPEEWTPDAEYVTSPRNSNGRQKHSQ